MNEKRVSIWWHSDGDTDNLFYCFHCRAPVMRYRGTVLVISPGNANSQQLENQPMKVPVTIKCQGRIYHQGCPYVYTFQGIAKKED